MPNFIRGFQFKEVNVVSKLTEKSISEAELTSEARVTQTASPHSKINPTIDFCWHCSSLYKRII